MARDPRIIVAHLITGLQTGGAERMLARLATRTDRERFRSIVVSMTGSGAIGPVIAAAGIEVCSLGMRRGRPTPAGLFRLMRLLRRNRPAIVQTWLYHADLLGLVARSLGLAPHLLWNIRCTETVGTAGLRRILAASSRLPDAVVVNSETGRRFHEHLRYRPRRWAVIPNGFDTDMLRPDPRARQRGRAELGLADGEVAILLPARYDPMKDHANFFAAAGVIARHRPELRFFLAGSGIDPDNHSLAGEIARQGLGGRAVLLGQRRDLDTLYPAFDLVTLSSAYGEGFPSVLGEAMACGVPCVATDSGDAPEILGDCGIVVPPRRPEALAAGWEELIARGAAGRAELGTQARTRIVARYGLDAIVGRYQALYAEIATRPSVAPLAPGGRIA